MADVKPIDVKPTQTTWQRVMDRVRHPKLIKKDIDTGITEAVEKGELNPALAAGASAANDLFFPESLEDAALSVMPMKMGYKAVLKLSKKIQDAEDSGQINRLVNQAKEKINSMHPDAATSLGLSEKKYDQLLDRHVRDPESLKSLLQKVTKK